MIRVKICPSCGALPSIEEKQCLNPKCRYIFKGDEKGIKVKSIKMDTLLVTPSIQELKDSLLKAKPISRRLCGEEIAFHIKRILLGLYLLVGGFLCYLMSWGFKDVKLVAGMFQIVGLLGMIVGIGFSVVLIVLGIIDMVVGPKHYVLGEHKLFFKISR